MGTYLSPVRRGTIPSLSGIVAGMCGIAGIVDPERPALEWAPALAEMRARLQHRGPDGDGEWFGQGVALTHTRLAIVDPAGGRQPMVSDDGRYVLVYNGELYNAAALRAELDYPFQTRCDTEVLLAAWARWGRAGLLRLNGMFAFFVWDRERSVGTLVRDRLGVKPALYSLQDGVFRFASEARALLPRSPALCEHAFQEWAVMPAFSGVSRSMFAGLEVLPPGGFLEIEDGAVRLTRWWRPTWAVEPEEAGVEPLIADLHQALKRAVGLRARAEVPVGTFLSGGLDSTIIAACAGPRPSWTIRFEGQSSYDYQRSPITRSDDTPHALHVAAELGLDARIVNVARDELARDLASIACVDDALPAWEQQLAQHRLARAASEEVRVVLVGDAADETHYGYDFLLDDAVTASVRGPLERFGSPTRETYLHARLRGAVTDRLAAEYEEAAARDGYGWGKAVERRRAATWLVHHRWLPRLLHNGDIHTMAFSLEARVPFSDPELLSVASRVPPLWGFREGIEKWVLRRAAPAAVPDSVRWRKKSALPTDQLAGPVYRAEVLNALKRGDSALDRYFDVNALRALAIRPGPLDAVSRSVLFQASVFAHWSRHFSIR